MGQKERPRRENSLIVYCMVFLQQSVSVVFVCESVSDFSALVCLQWVRKEDPDVLCLQETKCAEKALPSEITDMPEYPHKYWAGSEEKEGYSGVAMLCKTEPLNVTYGIGKCLFSFLYRFQYMAHVHC